MTKRNEDTNSERRLAENEVVFRQLNQQIHRGYDETNRLAVEDGQPEFLVSPAAMDSVLHFFCECADEQCISRVQMTVGEYERIHKHPNNFIIVPGHEVASIEEVIDEQPFYTVVRKRRTPPKHATKLNPTSVDNT
jgi:hypothetical protein